jgi:flagellar biosynthesis protein FlhG
MSLPEQSWSPGPGPGAKLLSLDAARRALAAVSPRIVAIGGGKGGIGKSLVATSLAVEYVRREQRVVLVDCDLGGANLHTLLGMACPRETLSDFIQRRVELLDDLAVATPLPQLRLISSARNSIQAANLMHQQKMRLIRAVRRLDADVVIVDLGAGTHYNVVDFFLLAHHGVLVVVPEPTSVENAYRFLKAAFLRKVKAVDFAEGLRALVQEALRERTNRTISPVELVEAVEARSPAAGAALREQLASFRPLLLVNQVREPADLMLGEGMCLAARKLFGLEMTYLGHLRHSEHIWRTMRATRRPFIEQRGTPFASDLAGLARRLDGIAAADAT